MESLLEQVRQLGITLSYHTSYAVNLADPLRELRTAARNLIGRCMELAYKLKAKWITIHPGYKIGWPDQKNERVPFFVESLKYLLEKAEKQGVQIAVENLNRLMQGEVFYLGDCFDQLRQIFSSSNSKFLKMTLDFGHAHLNEGVEKYLRTFADRIICTHIHDNMGQGVDQHLPVGKGSIDWRRACKVIKGIDYTGPLCFEVYSDEEKIAGMKMLRRLLGEEQKGE